MSTSKGPDTSGASILEGSRGGSRELLSDKEIPINPGVVQYMKTVICMGLVLAAVGCDRAEDKQADTAGRPRETANVGNAPADNTKKNERDRDTSTLTPGDQGESEVDRTITQWIRQGVVKDDTLSMTAKNVKIITVNSVVTLRGPVKSEKEKADIGALAQRAPGVKQVDNQLEIAAP